MNPDDRTILEQRAARLAQPISEIRASDVELFEFAIGRDRYGIAITEVAGVFRPGSMGILPGATGSLIGITSWHGLMLRVIDLKRSHGESIAGLDDRSWVVVVGTGQRSLGLLVSRVDGPRRTNDDIQMPSEGLASDRRFLLGTTSDGLQVLDSAALLAAYADGANQ